MTQIVEEYAQWTALHPDRRVPGESKQDDAWAAATKMIESMGRGDA